MSAARRASCWGPLGGGGTGAGVAAVPAVDTLCSVRCRACHAPSFSSSLDVCGAPAWGRGGGVAWCSLSSSMDHDVPSPGPSPVVRQRRDEVTVIHTGQRGGLGACSLSPGPRQAVLGSPYFLLHLRKFSGVDVLEGGEGRGGRRPVVFFLTRGGAEGDLAGGVIGLVIREWGAPRRPATLLLKPLSP
ncbi:hypothetical protein E2C01_057693 [Portunus trituberculatus]|uniref:Uncharacterized protein n=1 Tax=Portunus trituberculatus TaxID=210409 RepID=A0A5B7H435_PORTR|nr:hypothetical protein [Portunus trituberculatus]